MGSKPAVITIPAAPTEIDALDRSHPRSVFNLVPEAMQSAMAAIPDDMLDMEEDELAKLAFGTDKPKSVYTRLRIAFWDEYDRCQRYKEKEIDLQEVYRKLCSSRYFHKLVLTNPAKVAWLITPPGEYTMLLKDLHQMGIRAMYSALELNPVVEGKVNVKLIEAQNKIFQHIDMRLKGAIVQRIDQRNLNVNMNAGDASPEVAAAANRVSGMTMEEIEARIASIQQESKALLTPGEVQVDLMKNTRPIQEEAKDVVIEAEVVEATGT